MDTEDVLTYTFLCVPILVAIKEFPEFLFPLALGLIAAYLIGTKRGKK